mmetsp:Transcript_642/g.1420  ORF Transcript_642/g.1420 Transcript_642/m.1420 type:complete len:211 (-) Transcript_642:65-697(-)
MSYFCFNKVQTSDVSITAGSLVSWSRTSSIPRNNPLPRMSPMQMFCGCSVFLLSSLLLFCAFQKFSFRYSPVSKAWFCKSSDSNTSITANPAAAATGEPPNVLKYSTPNASKRSATARVMTTAPRLIPFPNGLPTVTMSGTMPWFPCSNAQNEVPSLPKPVCTSSAMNRPPPFRTASTLSRTKSSGGIMTPPTLIPPSIMKAPTVSPIVA